MELRAVILPLAIEALHGNGFDIVAKSGRKQLRPRPPDDLLLPLRHVQNFRHPLLHPGILSQAAREGLSRRAASQKPPAGHPSTYLFVYPNGSDDDSDRSI